MADLTATLKAKPLDLAYYSPIQWIRKTVNVADLATAGTDNIISIPAESVILDGWVVIRSTLVTGTSIRIMLNSVALTPVISTLTKGGAVRFDLTALGAVYVTAADTIDTLTAGSAFTAGQIDLVVGYASVQDNT